nr:hypothetical protein [Salicibibacter kimchii]
MNQRLMDPWVILAIILVAFNLRPAITRAGPLIGLLREDLQLTNSEAGVSGYCKRCCLRCHSA